MPDKPATVKQYLDALPDDRRKALQAVRKVIRDNLDPAYEERIQYGMIGYAVPHTVYPAGYHCDPTQPVPFAGIASQKNHMSIYLCNVYMDEAELEWFRSAWTRDGRRLDMGKGCVRFKKLEDVPLDVLGKAIKRTPVKKFLKQYEANLPAAARKRAASASARPAPAAKKPVTRKTAKKSATKKASKKTVTRKSSRRA